MYNWINRRTVWILSIRTRMNQGQLLNIIIGKTHANRLHVALTPCKRNLHHWQATRCDSCPFAQPQNQCIGSVSLWQNGDTSTIHLTHRILTSPKPSSLQTALQQVIPPARIYDAALPVSYAIGYRMHYLPGPPPFLPLWVTITKIRLSLKRNGSKLSFEHGFF